MITGTNLFYISDLNVIGGTETYNYKEIATMCFEAACKPVVIKRAPVFLFNVLAALPKNKKNGVSAMLRFSKFTLTNDLEGDTLVSGTSFKEYVKESFKNNVRSLYSTINSIWNIFSYFSYWI